MSRATRSVSDAIGHTVAAMVAVVQVSAVIARLLTQNVLRAVRIVLSPQPAATSVSWPHVAAPTLETPSVHVAKAFTPGG
jgi:hypothetical protein